LINLKWTFNNYIFLDDEKDLYDSFEENIKVAFYEFSRDKEREKNQNTETIDMLKIMELKLEELISEIKFLKSDKKMSLIFE
jgi:hypothetical protein